MISILFVCVQQMRIYEFTKLIFFFFFFVTGKPHKGVNPMKKVREQVQQEPSSNKEASCKVTDKELCSGQSVSSTPIK